MIAWLNPLALVGLVAAIAPIVIHLLRQSRSARVAFPSLRFVHPGRSVTTRIRRVADPWLLLLRVTVLVLAACALAQPVVLFPARVAAWNARVARAVVVDTSDSMRRHAAEIAAGEAADAEANSASSTARFATADLGEGIRQAARWLQGADPARREIVVVSDLQAGALHGRDFDGVPPQIGIRFVRVGSPPGTHAFTAGPLVGTGRVRTVRLTAEATAVSIDRGGAAGDGLRLVVAPGQEGTADALLRTVATAGAPAPAPARPVVVSFMGAAPWRMPLQPPAAAWMRAALTAVAMDADVAAAAGAASGGGPREPPWLVVVRDARGAPLAHAAASGSALVLDVAAEPGSFVGAAVVRAALLGQGTHAFDEEEIARIPDREIARWTRAAGPVEGNVGGSDARWFWMAALALLGIEGVLRRSRGTPRQEARADAA